MAKQEELVQGGKPSEMEKIKKESNYLRGTIAEGLEDRITGAISEKDNLLLKFHGSYQQDDRDLRNERRRQKLEPAYSFMIRVRVPGGVLTPQQWLEMDAIGQNYGGNTMRLTTRQTIQFHGIIKSNLKKTMQDINKAVMTSIAACGDVNRNVMCNPNPYQSAVHAEVMEWTQKINDHLLPRTKAYHEIWLDHEKVVDSRDDEPIYGEVYLPRKFKIGVAVPPTNDVDVFSQDLGLIAILEDGKLAGFNISVGGGMGMTHGDDTTYPQIGRVIGYSPLDKIIEVCENIVKIQRDFGNRSDRKHARFKYTIDSRGLDWVTNELNERLGWKLEEAREYHFDHNGDRLGWLENDGKWHFTMFIQSGRIKDVEGYELMTGLREIAKVHKGDFRVTGNQNVIIANVSAKEKAKINELIKKYGLTDGKHYTALKQNSMSCVAFPTCGLAMAESERYLPSLLDKLEVILEETGLREEEIVIRMTGCPNGCARPALAEIGFIGKAPGKYNLYLGGGFAGERLNKLYKENIGEEEILDTLRPIFESYAKERQENEHFGDYVIRAGIVKKVENGMDFHS
ncbi:assimilatory sulfite reductase (NADPH) hemoprotein subunit [Pullulanibacillus sp. KACC 23026]|uniref:assimilatory sulfite reductase (NADPH) hemoprotein subunit n=1 Tax=Pullulanibacillus sp. KACC 23026 TaxID=3028315 RepID=UPI0023B0E76C|nr:assimilatory sulfite reductase (NADPH) hemoprotein subunit [Pullulanibacillus sp. KACC 23026]WEG12919.1 assimilatory sulfite reductase (NADPH) hemoprotein subunit [Pullulanibacillus sp. KACC 23026]